MDPRHESPERAALTQLIILINHYIQNNIDDIFANEMIYQEIKGICETIYFFLGVEVDVETILSKQNLLSIDMVLFPHLNDVTENKFHQSKEFNQVITTIKLFTKYKINNECELNKSIIEIVNNYIAARM